MNSRCTLLTTTLALVALSPTLALAEPSANDKAMATQLYDDAQKSMADKAYAVACPKFRESQRLDPQLGTLLHLADCYEKAGKTASAWAAFKEGAEIAHARADARERVARERAVALETDLARLTISVPDGSSAGFRVVLDGQAIGQPLWGTAAPIDPGAHVIVVSADGREDRKYRVTVAAGALESVSVEPGAVSRAAPAAKPLPTPVETRPEAPTPSAADRAQRDRASKRPVLGYVGIGVGVVGVGVGAVAGAMVFSKKSTIDSHCDASKACDAEGLDAASSARTLSTVSTVGFVVGAVGLGAGLYFLLSGSGGAAPRTALSTRVVPGGGGLALVREF